MNPSCEANVDKKRKEVSTKQVLGSNQHLDLSHLALIPSQMNLNCKELEASQAKTVYTRIWKNDFRRLENPQNHVSEESIVCRSKTVDSDRALESAFFR